MATMIIAIMATMITVIIIHSPKAYSKKGARFAGCWIHSKVQTVAVNRNGTHLYVTVVSVKISLAKQESRLSFHSKVSTVAVCFSQSPSNRSENRFGILALTSRMKLTSKAFEILEHIVKTGLPIAIRITDLRQKL